MDYYIYQKTGTSEYEKVGTVTNVKTYTVTNLKPKTAYTFAVSAWNGIRESAKSEAITVTTSNIATTAVTLTISNRTLEVGNTVTAQVTITPANQTDGDVSYTISDPTIATVNATSGVITGVKAGTTDITARVGSITSAKITIAVYEALVTVTGLAATGTTATGTVLSWS